MEKRLGCGLIKSKVNSLFCSVSYKYGDTLIDVGDEWEAFRNTKAVLLTHAHFDHIYGLNKLLSISPKTIVYTNNPGKDMLLDVKKNMSFYHGTPYSFEHPERIIIIEDGAKVDLGSQLFAKAIFTPGHSPSCITWQVNDNLFTGDSYIPGIKTVTNLPGGNKSEAESSLQLILDLESVGNTVYPGHYIK